MFIECPVRGEGEAVGKEKWTLQITNRAGDIAQNEREMCEHLMSL